MSIQAESSGTAWPPRESHERPLTSVDRLTLFLFGAYWVAKPFYLFAPGSPQPADAIGAAFLGLTLISRAGRPLGTEAQQLLSWVAVFCGYAIAVNLAWALVNPSPRFLWSASYYAYNFMLAYATASLCCRYGRAAALCIISAVSAAVILQIVLAPLTLDGTRQRQLLFFNNPNQLAEFCVFSGALFYYCRRWLAVPSPLALAFGAAITALTVLSGSRAGIAALFLLILVVSRARLGSLVAVAAAIALGLFLVGDSEVVQNVIERYARSGTFDHDSPTGRGYDRVWRNPEHLLLGAGEGAHHRFDRYLGELHSTPATIILSYGVPGTLAFAMLLRRVYLSSGGYALLFFLPVLVLGLAHQTLRFSPVWILLIVLGSSAASGPLPRRTSTPPQFSARLAQTTR